MLEALASMSVFAIVVAAGAPSVRSVSNAMSLESEGTSLSMALTQGRITAINRGHVVSATFTTTGYTIVDTQQGNQVVAAGSLPTGITLQASAATSFTPLGTLSAPLTVTLSRPPDTRVIQVALTGMVDIQ